jgi:hypothetical protein
MNIFNRIIVILLLLFIAVASTVSLVNLFLNLYDFAEVAGQFITFIQNVGTIVLALILFGLLAISIILLVLEFRRSRAKVASTSVEQSGKTMINLKTASNRIEERLMNIEGVVNPRVEITPRDNGIIINVSSQLEKSDHVSMKSQEIRQVASDFASEELGFNVAQTNYTATGFTEKKEARKSEHAQEQQEPAHQTRSSDDKEKKTRIF